MIPPRYQIAFDGTTLEGETFMVNGGDGEFYGRVPDEWIDKEKEIGENPVEITLTFKAWVDYTVTNFADGPHLRLRWRHA